VTDAARLIRETSGVLSPVCPGDAAFPHFARDAVRRGVVTEAEYGSRVALHSLLVSVADARTCAMAHDRKEHDEAGVTSVTPASEPRGFELEVLTAAALCALPDPPKEARLLSELVVRGYRTVIGGDTGAGKSTMALAIVAAVVHGEDFLGFQGAGDCRALVIDLEQGLRSVKRRLREAGLHESERLDYVRVPDGLELDRKADEMAAVDELLASATYDVVLLDPWYKVHGGDSNDERQIVELMRLLDRWRERDGFALVLPMHTRKPPPDAGPRKLTIHDLFGSSAAVRGAEVVLGLQLVHPGYSRLYFFKCRDGDDELPVNGEPWGLLFDRESGFRREPDQETKQESLVERVETFLRENPRSTTNAVAKAVEAGKDRVTRALHDSDRFAFEAGPNRSHLWVVSDAQNHPDHLFPAEAVSGGRAVVTPLKGGTDQTTHRHGGSQ